MDSLPQIAKDYAGAQIKKVKQVRITQNCFSKVLKCIVNKIKALFLALLNGIMKCLKCRDLNERGQELVRYKVQDFVDSGHFSHELGMPKIKDPDSAEATKTSPLLDTYLSEMDLFIKREKLTIEEIIGKNEFKAMMLQIAKNGIESSPVYLPQAQFKKICKLPIALFMLTYMMADEELSPYVTFDKETFEVSLNKNMNHQNNAGSTLLYLNASFLRKEKGDYRYFNGLRQALIHRHSTLLNTSKVMPLAHDLRNTMNKFKRELDHTPNA